MSNFLDSKVGKQILIIIGIIFSAIGINGFLAPADLLSTGLAGIVVIFNKLFGINQGIAIIIMNIPIFLICKKYVDKEFFYSSIINMFIFSFSLGVTENLYKYITINDTMVQSIFGGVLIGAGTGLIFKANSSVGGLDIVMATLKLKYDISIKNASLFINFFIICAGGILFGSLKAMYTLISMYLTSVSIDIAKDCFNQQKLILLISEKYNEIASNIMMATGKGVTFLDAEGAYSHNKKKMIYCVVSSNQIAKIKEIIYKEDKHAFISINNIDEVKGGGFKGKKL
ncbi:YitT family protein [Terrisporobacter sp.]|uniref:YitT family protein n=1 Tax=Terrisporobacter sp. TaxID=1965305 RepID=UPI00260508A0|nr:YitT family protein [Terrisporobacter sp.]